jgi:hypothetical protein
MFGTGVSEHVVVDDPRSSDAGPSTDPLEKLTHCPLQPMGVAEGASDAAAHAETEDEGLNTRALWWCPLKGGLMGVKGDVVDGRQRWLLTWRHQLLGWTHGWC